MGDDILFLLGHLRVAVGSSAEQRAWIYGQNPRLVKAYRLKYGIPTESSWPSRGHDGAISAAFKQDGLSVRASTVCERAQRIRVFRWEGDEKIVQTLAKLGAGANQKSTRNEP